MLFMLLFYLRQKRSGRVANNLRGKWKINIWKINIFKHNN